MQLAACLQEEAGQFDEQEWHLLLHGRQAESAGGREALQETLCLTASSGVIWEDLKDLESLPAFQVCACTAHTPGDCTLHGIKVLIRVAAAAGLAECCS